MEIPELIQPIEDSNLNIELETNYCDHIMDEVRAVLSDSDYEIGPDKKWDDYRQESDQDIEQLDDAHSRLLEEKQDMVIRPVLVRDESYTCKEYCRDIMCLAAIAFALIISAMIVVGSIRIDVNITFGKMRYEYAHP